MISFRQPIGLSWIGSKKSPLWIEVGWWALFVIAVACIAINVCIAIAVVIALLFPTPVHAAQPACMSLLNPDVLICEGNRVCDAAGGKPKCQTVEQLQRSWRGHPERRAEFYRKLYGAEK